MVKVSGCRPAAVKSHRTQYGKTETSGRPLHAAIRRNDPRSGSTIRICATAQLQQFDVGAFRRTRVDHIERFDGWSFVGSDRAIPHDNAIRHAMTHRRFSEPALESCALRGGITAPGRESLDGVKNVVAAH